MALAALALVVFGAYDSYPAVFTKTHGSLKTNVNYEFPLMHFPPRVPHFVAKAGETAAAQRT